MKIIKHDTALQVMYDIITVSYTHLDVYKRQRRGPQSSEHHRLHDGGGRGDPVGSAA